MKRAIQLAIVVLGALLSIATSRVPPPQAPAQPVVVVAEPEPEPEVVVVEEPAPPPPAVILIQPAPPPRPRFAQPPP